MLSLVQETLRSIENHPRFDANGLMFLSDLTPAEQNELSESIERAILPGDVPYQELTLEIAQRLYARMEEIAVERCAYAGTMRSQLSVMVDVASEGAATILQQWPDRFDMLQVLPFNGLPASLRRQVWEMRLREHMDALPLIGELKTIDESSLVFNSCRDAVAALGLPSLTARVMPMKDVICHLRSLHRGRSWTPLYLALTPLVAAALGGNGANMDAEQDFDRLPSDSFMRLKGGGGGGDVLPWCSDRVSPIGAEDGRGLLRCFEALLKVVGLQDAMKDPYSAQPDPADKRGGALIAPY
jgi:hypothetical protein